MACPWSTASGAEGTGKLRNFTAAEPWEVCDQPLRWHGVCNFSPPMTAQGWEYKLVHIGNPLQADVEERANALGKIGWELVCTDAGVWIFKRPTEAVDESVEALLEQTVPIATAVDPSEGAVVLPVPPTQEPRRRSHTD